MTRRHPGRFNIFIFIGMKGRRRLRFLYHPFAPRRPWVLFPLSPERYLMILHFILSLFPLFPATDRAEEGGQRDKLAVPELGEEGVAVERRPLAL